MTFKRYAVFFSPASGDLAEFGASWLGWDARSGVACAHPDIADLPLPISDITQAPRRYGLHATIKPPFQPASAATEKALSERLDRFCKTTPPIILPRIKLVSMGRFLALTPIEPPVALNALAAKVVKDLDAFRAAPSDQDLNRFLQRRLSAAQESLLRQWGYPYLMECFRFHITLSGKLNTPQIEPVRAALELHLKKVLENGMEINALSLMGEDENGFFHLISDHFLKYEE